MVEKKWLYEKLEKNLSFIMELLANDPLGKKRECCQVAFPLSLLNEAT